MCAKVLQPEPKVLLPEPKVLPLEPKVLQVEPIVLPPEPKVLPFGAKSTAVWSQKYCHRNYIFLAGKAAGKYTNIFGKNETQMLL